MTPNDPRRDRDHLEDNPFIAFRRFADSQVSSLLNTVFTLPATLANFNNAHVAREQCLFGRADQAQCERLSNLEDSIAKLRSDGRELYRVGDLQQVLKKGEELMLLDRQADNLRKEIVETARSNDRAIQELGRSEIPDSTREQTDLVEKIGNEKGQHWGWSWSWGFPASFQEEHSMEENAPKSSRSRCRRRQDSREKATEKMTEEDWEHFDAKFAEFKKLMHEGLSRSTASTEPQGWSWSFHWPPPADAPKRDLPANAPSSETFDNFGSSISTQVQRIFDMPSYSPKALQEDDDLKRAGLQWRDAFEDLVRVQRGAPLIPSDKLGQSSDMTHDSWVRRFWDPKDASFIHREVARQSQVEYPKRIPWDGEEVSDEPSYEYSHDHEDQHDDPPTPKNKQGKWSDDAPETELDAYERLLGPGPTVGAPSMETERPSILSTLTTTERSVAPDGSVTTKVILKKRFTDGREESSETVHTQRGQEMDSRDQDPWKAMQAVQASPHQEPKKKSGWFWSS